MNPTRMMKPNPSLKTIPFLCRTFTSCNPWLRPTDTTSTTTVQSTPPQSTPYYNDSRLASRQSEAYSLTQFINRNQSNAGGPSVPNSPIESSSSRFQRHNRQLATSLEESGRKTQLERQITRKYKLGDVYSPHDLSPVEAEKWRKRRTRERDVFDVLGINPLDEYKNVSMMAEYMTSMGRIKHRRETGLRAVNQRRIAKAIRRAVSMGLIPSVHRHPEVLETEVKARNFRMHYAGR